MCGGGSAPSPPDYAAQERARAEGELRLMEARRASEAADRAQKQAAFDARLNPARQTAFNEAQGYLSGLGFNDGFQSDINSEISRLVGSIPEFDNNPGNYLSGRDIGEAVYNRKQQDTRNQYENSIYGVAPEGFAKNYLPDTYDDAVLQGILTPEYEKANLSLNDALQRGILSAQGFQSAQNILGQQKSTAQAKLNQVGLDTLEQGRNSLRSLRDESLNQARNYRLAPNSSLDFSTLGNQIQSRLGEFQGGLEGQIRTNLGGQPLFDIGQLIAGSRQSSFNPTTSNTATTLQKTLADREKERNQQRGIGNSGAF